ncbi:MAG: RagB/SusD family nutrient uptake outer membrane protein, partial [Bacteroidaceae bacterium]|nr:RagB/SusD family nutrient uptake outer membrane protein [Bacteroidaceae bacterium]
DQLTGVYTQMMGSSMYGMQMTFGFAEVLSQNYNINPNSNVWRYVKDYDYRNSSVESILSGIWLGTYSCIANLNILIENIERADKNIFTAGNDSVYLGEALGLRAFLHLELMRYFACAPSMDRQAKGVPYVTTYGTHVTEQKTVDETMNLIIADLLKARDLLTADPSNVDGPRFSYDQSQVRKARFNYNACVGALARAYMWNGDKANALRYAKEIIAVNDPDDEKARSGYPFSWVHYTVFQSTQKTDYQPSFYTEHLMRITVNNWEDGGNTYFHAAKGVDALSPSYEYANDVYELSAGMGTDYRLAYCFEQDGSDRYLSKFWYVEGRAANGYLPVLRMTEAYYIAAECLKDTAPEKAIAILEKVRTNRHLDLSPLPTTLTSAEIQNEIFKEYRKEFMGEGQLFFYYKRLNATDINGSPQKGSKSVYVMPIPSTDQEFGGYTN